MYLLAVGVVIMLAGLLFGYDQGVISGALDGIQKQFSVGTLLLEVITSWVTLGAMVGALVAGGLADRLGRRLDHRLRRRPVLAGALVEALAPGSGVLVAGRLLVGFGVGVASVAAPSTPPSWPPPGCEDAWSPSTNWPSPSASSWPTSPTTC